jgi:hypothetical protein
VFYVAPRFHRLREFNTSYRSTTVVDDSAWIPLSNLPSISDDLPHHITYRTGLDAWFASPEPEPIGKTFDGKNWRAYIVLQLETSGQETTLETFSQLRSVLLGALQRARVRYLPEPALGANDTLELVRDIAYLSRTFFGAEFLFVHQLNAR